MKRYIIPVTALLLVILIAIPVMAGNGIGAEGDSSGSIVGSKVRSRNQTRNQVRTQVGDMSGICEQGENRESIQIRARQMDCSEREQSLRIRGSNQGVIR